MKNKNSGSTMLGVTIGNSPLSDLTAEAMEAVNGKRGQTVFVCANPHSLVVAKQDMHFRDALNSSEQVVADGVGVVVMGRVMGIGVEPRVTGSDYFYSVMRSLNRAENGGRVFFVGVFDASRTSPPPWPGIRLSRSW